MANWRGTDNVAFEATIDAVDPALSFGAGPVDTESRNRNRRSVVRRALVTADALALVAAYILVVAIYDSQTVDRHGSLLGFLGMLPVWLLGATFSGLYDRDTQRPEHSTLDDIGGIVQLASIGVWATVLTLWLSTGSTDVPALFLYWVMAILFVVGARTLARTAVRRHPTFPQNTIIVGAGEVGQLVGRKLVQHPEFGLRLVGFVDADPKDMRGDLDGLPILGSPGEVEWIVRNHDVGRVIVAFSNDRHDLLVQLIRSLRDLNVQIDLVPRLFEAVGPVAGVHLVEGFPLVGLQTTQPLAFARGLKRGVDVVVSGALLVLLAPLFAWFSWRIRRESPGPAFFRQTRLGEGQRPFTLLKFRTMTVDADDEVHREYVRGIMDTGALPTGNNLYKLDRSSDVTPFGAWLRRTSLDELPQLINVFRGEMSLVGPRPCMSYETELFEPYHFGRFLVPAGMTGLWQVAARAHSTMKEALDLDVTYARNWSLRLDLQLLARTPLALLRGGGTS